jgi:hypothetical protein
MATSAIRRAMIVGGCLLYVVGVLILAVAVVWAVVDLLS